MAATRPEDVDTRTYWSDVQAALAEICGLSAKVAATAVSDARADLSCLSDWGRLLAYHESVPQVAEDLWLQWAGHEVAEDELQEVRDKLIAWYAGTVRKSVGQ